MTDQERFPLIISLIDPFHRLVFRETRDVKNLSASQTRYFARIAAQALAVLSSPEAAK